MTTFSGLGQNMVNPKKWDLFFGPKFRFLVQKSDFCHATQILVDDPFLALGMTVNFPFWKRLFDFPFQSYSCFHKKIRLTCQKVFPLPTLGFYCTETALALSAAGPSGGMDNKRFRLYFPIVTFFFFKITIQLCNIAHCIIEFQHGFSTPLQCPAGWDKFTTFSEKPNG